MPRAQANLSWLERAREALNRDPEFRKLGSTDLVLGLAIGDETRLVEFEAFEIARVVETQRSELRDADITIEMSARDWNAYLRQRARSKGPTLLSLDLEQRVVRSRDPLAGLKLTEYNRSLQKFIDTGAALSA